MTDSLVADIALKIGDAVNYRHSHNPSIIHQDLKPANVLVCVLNAQTKSCCLVFNHNYIGTQELYICDLGIAKIKQLTDISVG